MLNKLKKATLYFVLCMVLTIAFVASAFAADTSSTSSSSSSAAASTSTSSAPKIEKPQITSENKIVVMSVQTGQLLLNTANGVKVDPTCSAKLMTAMLVYDEFKTLDKLVTVEADALKNIGKIGDISAPRLGIKAGDSFPARQLFQATLISAANDACNALAYSASSGDLSAFVKKMNDRAKELGCENTFFTNSTGLYDGDAYTTVEDVAKIAAAFYKYNTLLDLSSQPTFVIGGSTVHTKNYLRSENLLRGYVIKDSKGMIAGQRTVMGDYCLITAAESDGMGYIYVIMEAPGEIRNTDGTRAFPNENAYTDMKKIFNWAKSSFGYKLIVKKGEVMGELPVEIAAGNLDHVNYTAAEDIEKMVPKDIDLSKVERRTTITKDKLIAPVPQNTIVGYMEVYYEGELLKKIDLITNGDVDRSELLSIFASAKTFLFGGTMKTIYKIILSVVILYILFVVGTKIYKLVINVKKVSKSKGITPKDKQGKNNK